MSLDGDKAEPSQGTSLQHQPTVVETRHDPKAPYLIVHRVLCPESGHKNHHQHKSKLDYLDVPRILVNANQTSILEGQEPIRNLDWYLEDNSDKHFIVINTYDCVQYHREITNDFERLLLPSNVDRHVVHKIKPYLHVLKQDAKEADRTNQIISPSSRLERVLDTLQGSFPQELDDWKSKIHLAYPYPQLWRYKDILRGATERLTTEDRSGVMALLRFLEEYVSEEWTDAESLFETGRVSKQHWTKLFRPHEVVVTLQDGEPRAFICEKYPDVLGHKLHFQGWSWEFDGNFSRKDFSFEVHWPNQSEVASITELSHYPLRFDKTGLKERLHRRGATFWSCRQRRYVSYISPSQGAIEKAQQRYMVDMTTYKLLHVPDPETTASTSLDEPTMLDDNLPDNSRYPSFSILLPAKIKGFGFHDKKWVDLLVRSIEDIRWNKSVFTNHLVLDEAKKELIQALVTVHLKIKTKEQADFMPGKGEGLLILLHGGPGTGKTLTAESVAELAARPLYRVTCGDIGTNPEEVEKYLTSVFLIGGIWDCVILLDEADVFLEERTKMDLERNALVSVFLRALEYSGSILILTSNRIGTIDEAFKSRVQLSLHYPPLKRKNRLRIWENFVSLLEDGSDATHLSEIRQRLTSLASHKINGRQIRNTMNTARQLAQFKGEPLGYRHLNQAIRNVLDFEKYVTTVRGNISDEEYAQEQGLRYSKDDSAQEYALRAGTKKRKADEDSDSSS